jgi:hypothetical protein
LIAAPLSKEIKVGKPTIPAPRDMDWVKATKDKLGQGFAGNAVVTLVRGNNAAAGSDRSPPEHRYQVTDYGQGSGQSKLVTQNRLANQRKK